jgi:serine/threonine-protein kinase
MSPLSPDQWQVLSPYLDKALTLSETECANWLEALQAENPDVAGKLRELLKQHRAAERAGYLETGLNLHAEGAGLAGQTIGAYRLISLIGQGGMGTVCLAERSDGRFQRKAAVKFLSAARVGQGGEERFKREGAILGRLTHPNIAELLDAGVTPAGHPYLVLEYVEGEAIDRYCDERKLDVGARVGLFLDVLGAVAHAHANLIVHRDIKPSNVLVNKNSQVKLLDFGIAKLLEGEGQQGQATLLTREAGSALTPHYAAPEQVTDRPVTTATDVYALGVLLYVLLTGQHPAGPGPHSPADLLKAIIEVEPRRLSEVARSETSEGEASAAHRGTVPDKLYRQLRGDLDTIVAKALKKNPQERYASVSALAADLKRYLENEPISARPDTIRYRAVKFVRRNRLAVALATVAAIAVVAGITGTLVQARTTRIQRDLARTQRDFAMRQIERDEALTEFDQFLLSEAAPAGKPFTVNELLARAEQIVERQHESDPANRIELLLRIGIQFSIQEQNDKARRVLEKAYKLSRGITEVSVRADASCTLASALAQDGELDRAESLFQEGMRELPDEPQFALLRTECLRRGSEVAQQRGDARIGIARMEAARLELHRSGIKSGFAELATLTELGGAYRLAGDNISALPLFEQASALMSNLGRDETHQALALFNDWAIALRSAGRPLEAEQLYRRAIEISRAGQTEDSVLPSLLNNYSGTLRHLNRLSEAADYAERAYSKGKQQGSEITMIYSLNNRVAAYLEQRDFVRAAAALNELEPRVHASFAADSFWVAALASAKALLAAGRGNRVEAMALSNQAVSTLEAGIKGGGRGSDFLPVILLRRARIELDARQPAEAEADALRALTLLRGSIPAESLCSYAGDAYLALGRAFQAEGKTDEARAAFRSAVEQLEPTVGSDHPDTRAARRLAELETPRP